MLTLAVAALVAATPPTGAPTVAAVPKSIVQPKPAAQPAKAKEPSPGFRIPAGEKPVAYALAFDVDPDKDSFSGTEKLTVHLDTAQKTVWLHARNLAVSSAKVAGKTARFQQVDDDGMAGLFLDAPVGPGDVDVDIAWTAKLNGSLEGIYKVVAEGNAYAFTQFEAISARNAFPCFDEPGFKTPFQLSFDIPEGDRVAGNTREARSSEIGGKRVHVELTKTEPLPVYLVAFAVGPLDIVEGKTLPPDAMRKEPLPIRGVAIKGHGPQMKGSLDVAAKALDKLEHWFGVGYPFHKMDIVAVPDFAAGAMENAGFVTFRDSLLFVDDKSPIGLQKANVYVIAHEFAHQWFGDLVTLAWWDDIWLNEAFATWMETPIVDAIRPDFRAVVDMRSSLDGVTGQDSLVSARQIRQPVLNKGDILNAFDGITYEKGASVIEMFASYMGKQHFQQGVRNYIKEHAFGTATAADLLGALSKAAGKDIATPFSTFLDQPGVPFVKAAVDCSQKGHPKLTLAQERYLPVGSTGDRNKTWQVPVCVKVDGRGPVCTLLKDASGELPLHWCPKAVHPSFDGVGYYRWSLPADQMKALSSTLKHLTPGERISFANAVRAGFGAGTLPFADALSASLPLAGDEEADIAATPVSFLGFAKDELVEPEARPKVQAKVAETYRSVLERVKLDPKPKEDPRARERRTLALRALVWVAEDEATLDALAQRGRAVLDLDNPDKEHRKVHVEKIPGDLAAQAVAAAVLRGDDKTWDDVSALLSTESDSLVRSWIIGALSSVTDAKRATKAVALALDPRLKVNEVMTPLFSQARDPRTRDAAWSWFQAHYDAVAARLPEEFGADRLASVFSSYCSEDKAKELEAFFTPKKDKVPGMERALAIALESVRLCAAKKAVHEDSARHLFPK